MHSTKPSSIILGQQAASRRDHDAVSHLLLGHQGQGPHQVCQPRKFRFVMHFKTHSKLTLLTFQPKLSWWRGQLCDWEVHRPGQRTRGGGQVCKDLLFDPRKFAASSHPNYSNPFCPRCRSNVYILLSPEWMMGTTVSVPLVYEVWLHYAFSLSPLICLPECTMAFIRHTNLYIVATTKTNSNIAMIFCLLHTIRKVMEDYFR